LGNTLPEQYKASRLTAKTLAGLVAAGHRLVITHGNGPQVGMIYQAMEAGQKENPKMSHVPLSVCGAMSQGYIGYDMQCALREELWARGLDIPVASIVTQTVVDPADPAFENPTKPIGVFYTEEEAKRIAAETGYTVKEDAGRGWRRVVASPKPIDIIEKDTIKTLLDAGHVVVAVGGGGIPVARQGTKLLGQGAVVDKDFASAVLADMIDADALVILTAVEKVSIDFRKPTERQLDSMTVEEAKRYIAEGQFAPGSMLPKVEAAVSFAKGRVGRKALITLLERVEDGLAGKTGTVVTA
jgi:carbamate kinase